MFLNALAVGMLSCSGFGAVMPTNVNVIKNLDAVTQLTQPEPEGPHDWLIKHAVIRDLLKFTNEERARQGLTPLKLNPEMCVSAQEYAVWMAETGYYQHSALPWREVIHHGPYTAKGAVNDWIWSPSHYSILLSGAEVGFGYMVLDNRTYWVGEFK